MSNMSLNPLPYGTNQEFANNAMLIGAKVKKVKKPCYEHFQSNTSHNNKPNNVQLNNVKTFSIRDAYSNPLAWACYCKDNKCYCPLMY
jgi:hypothetical protein